MDDPERSITDLLSDRTRVDLDALVERLYPELRRLARSAMRQERGEHTLQSTALVHEAYLRLTESELVIESRAHFLALAARVMRQVLIDHARGRDRQKRGGDQCRISLTEADREGRENAFEILALDRALASLQVFDERRAKLLELQLFAGSSYAEMAEAMGISEATVHRELRLARAWLQREMAGEPP
jgi:RNA polymerase sigma factor (TIGR02999 family)